MDLNNKSRFFLLELQNSQDFQTDDYRDLVKQLMNKYESLKPLVLALKNILKRGNLNDPYKGGISSYGLILMIVYFLQQQAYAGIDISLN